MKLIESSVCPIHEAEWTDDPDYDFLDSDDMKPDMLFPVFRDKRTLLIPYLQAMDEYIKLHYTSAITKRLCSWIARNASAQEALPDSVVLGDMRFWRESRSSLLADITVSVIVITTHDGNAEPEERQYIVQMGFWMDECITYLSRSFYVFESAPDHSFHWLLSEYLIPHFEKTDVEREAQDMLQTKLRDGWLDQHENSAYALADQLGLNIVRFSLHGYSKTRSVLFFHKGTITVDIEDAATGSKYRETVSIAANTIVINDAVVKSSSAAIDIYHECIHSEWHYLFYCLQEMHNNDLRQIRKQYKIRYDKTAERDPLSWLEWQARQGSMSLWMPYDFMQKSIRELGNATQHTWMHQGFRFDHIGRSIAAEYNIPKYRVRARLINMGHIEAKGALNYLDDHYIRPFCFSRKGNHGSFTYFITSKEFSKLYQEDQHFRSLIQTGHFVFAEGHVCWADPKYIVKESSGPSLTAWANAHVDECCLRFVEVYEQDETLAYRFGRLNSDESFNNHFYQYPGCGDISGLSGQEMDRKLRDYIDSLPRSFPKMLTRFMADTHMTEEKLICATGLSESSVTRLRNNPRGSYKVDQVVALIAVFRLPPLVSTLFLQSAGIDLNGNSRYSRDALVVYTLYQYPIEKIQDILNSMGFQRLKLADENDERKVG